MWLSAILREGARAGRDGTRPVGLGDRKALFPGGLAGPQLTPPPAWERGGLLPAAELLHPSPFFIFMLKISGVNDNRPFFLLGWVGEEAAPRLGLDGGCPPRCGCSQVRGPSGAARWAPALDPRGSARSRNRSELDPTLTRSRLGRVSGAQPRMPAVPQVRLQNNVCIVPNARGRRPHDDAQPPRAVTGRLALGGRPGAASAASAPGRRGSGSWRIFLRCDLGAPAGLQGSAPRGQPAESPTHPLPASAVTSRRGEREPKKQTEARRPATWRPSSGVCPCRGRGAFGAEGSLDS